MTSRIFHFLFFEEDLQATPKSKRRVTSSFARQTIASRVRSFFKRDLFYSLGQGQFYTASFEGSFEEVSPSLEESASSKEISSSKPEFELGLFKSIIFNSSDSILSTMIPAKIRSFKGLRDGREDPEEYIEDIDWAYERNFKTADVDEATANKFKRMLFRQNLEDDAHAWYRDLESDLKQDWSKLLEFFLKYYEIFVKDAQARKFELRMQLAQLKQGDQELISDYIKRASDISRKLSNDEIDVGMAILRGMKDVSKREQVNFECQKGQDYSFIAVDKLIRAVYSEIGKLNPFDSGYKEAMQVVLSHTTNSDQINDELLRQVLINSNQVFSAMLQALRSLNFNSGQFTGSGQRRSTSTQQSGKDFAHIICYICKQSGHYASHCPDQSDQKSRITEVISHAVVSANQVQSQRQAGYSSASNQSFLSSELTRLSAISSQSSHSQAVSKSQHESRSAMSNAVTLASSLSILKRAKVEDYHIDDENNGQNFLSSVACILSAQKSYLATVMAAQNAKGKQKASQATTASFSGVKKSKLRLNSPAKVSKKGVEYVFNAESQDDEGDKENQEPEEMDISGDEADNGESTFTYQSTSQSISWRGSRSFLSQLSQSVSQNSTQYEFRNSPPIKLNKKGNLTHLVPYKSPKVFDFIRGLLGASRFNVDIIMNLPLTLSLGQFFDKSDVIRLELAGSMQRSTAKYRVRKASGQSRGQQGTTASLAMAVTKAKAGSSVIIVHAHEDDGQSQSLMVISWIGNVELPRTLVDGGSVVELISRQKFLAMESAFFVRTDGHLRVNLVTDHVETLTNYIVLFVNVEGIEAVVRAYIVDNQVYDLLLGIPWMRRVVFNSHYGTGEVTITGRNGEERRMSTQIFSIHVDLSTVEVDSDDEASDLADAVCQLLLDEQLN